MVYLCSFIILIAVSVISHEFGHFLFAKCRNVYVHEFSFGMGPIICSKQKGETLYSVRAFPIGGFVRLEGEDQSAEAEESSIDVSRRFYAKKAWERLLILAGGIMANFLLAWILISSYLFAVGSYNAKSTEIGRVMENTAAYEIGLKAGDRIVSVNDRKLAVWIDISKTINSFKSTDYIIAYSRKAEIKKVSVTLIPDKSGRKVLGVLPSKINYSLFSAAKESFIFSVTSLKLILKSIITLVTGKGSRGDIAGPIGIAKMSGEAANNGIWSFLAFMALINLNLGLVNLLPFPALDGGRIIFVLIEMFSGKKVPVKFETYLHTVGFMLLILLIIMITGIDILKLLRCL